MATRAWTIAASLMLAAVVAAAALLNGGGVDTGPFHGVHTLNALGYAPPSTDAGFFDASLWIDAELASDALVLSAKPVDAQNLRVVGTYVVGPDRSSSIYLFSGTVLDEADGLGNLFAIPAATTLGKMEQELEIQPEDVADGSWVVVMDYQIDDPSKTAFVKGIELEYTLQGRRYRDTTKGFLVICGVAQEEESCSAEADAAGF